MKFQEIVTKSDNETLDEIRVLGAIGVLMVGGAAIFALPVLEVGGAIAAIITSMGGAVRLRGKD